MAVGRLIEFLAFENEFFSEIIATVILKTLHRIHYDDVKPMLEATIYLLHIHDSLT